MTLKKSFVLPLKGKWMYKCISRENLVTEHKLRQLCNQNQAAFEKCQMWKLLLDRSVTRNPADL